MKIQMNCYDCNKVMNISLDNIIRAVTNEALNHFKDFPIEQMIKKSFDRAFFYDWTCEECTADHEGTADVGNFHYWKSYYENNPKD